MYPGMINSPETTITNNINESDTIIYVLDPARVPEPPNLMTLGTGTNAETVKVLEINGNSITVERGFQGVAKAWPAGTVIARNFTEYDYNALKENIEDLEATKETPQGAQAKANAAENAAKQYADQRVNALAGEGNTKTVKQIDDELASHKAETVSKIALVSEPYDQLTKTTVNLGFRPKFVVVSALIQFTKYESVGYTDGSLQYCKYKYVEADTYNMQIDIIRFDYDGSNYLTGTVDFNDTGIEITWNMVGTLPGASGNRRFTISAMAHGGV